MTVNIDNRGRTNELLPAIKMKLCYYSAVVSLALFKSSLLQPALLECQLRDKMTAVYLFPKSIALRMRNMCNEGKVSFNIFINIPLTLCCHCVLSNRLNL